jgi:site-specific recombinase XerD
MATSDRTARTPRETTPLRRRRDIDILSPDDVLALMRRCSRRAPTGVRNRALIALLYGSGLRVGEALALKPKDLDLDGLAVTVQSGKGARRRVAALLPDAVDAIERWLDRRTVFGIGSDQPLFCTLARGAAGPHPTVPGRRLSREYFARFLRKAARHATPGRRVHPHALRHSHADLLRRRGFDVEEIRRQLGHRDLLVTTRYLDHLGSHDLPNRVRSIGPVFAPPKPPREELGELLGRLSDAEVTQLVTLFRRAAG